MPNPNTQNTPATNPNNAPNPNQSVYTDLEKVALDINKVEAWRKHQSEILSNLRYQDPNSLQGTYADTFNAGVEDSLDEYLEQQGVDKSSDGYARLREIYRDSSIDKVRDSEWYISPSTNGTDPNDHDSPRDKTISSLNIEREKKVENPENEKTLEELRTAKHEAYVDKIRGPVWLRPKLRKELDDKYQQAEQAYREVLDETTKADLQRWVDEGLSNDEIQQKLASNVNETFRGDVEAQRQLLVERSGKIGELMEKYANMKKWQKVAVGLGIGASGVLMGAAAGVVAGAIGAGVGALSAGALTAGSTKMFGAARMYKLRQADLFKKQDDLAEFKLESLGDGINTPTTEGVRRLGLDFLSKQSKNQLDRGEKIKRRAVYWTMGSVALGGFAGALSHAATAGEAFGDHVPGGWLQHWIENRDHGGDAAELRHGGFGDFREIERPEIGLGNEAPPPSSDEVIQQYVEQHTAAQTIDSGEGWYQTFNELGVKPDYHQQLLQEVGPDLQNIDYGDVKAAYWDEAAGEWRINMTSDGKMSPEALRLITERANEHGYLENPLSIEAPAPVEDIAPEVRIDAVTDQIVEQGNKLDVNVVSSGEGWYQKFDEIRSSGLIDIPTENYNSFLGEVGPDLAKLHYGDGTPVAYFDRFAQEWRMYKPPVGEQLPRDAIRTITRFALANGYISSEDAIRAAVEAVSRR